MSQPIRPLAIGRPLLSPVKNNTGLYSDLGTPDEFLVAEVQGGQNPDSEMGMYVRLFLAAPEMFDLLRDVRRYVVAANLRGDGYAEIDLKAIDALLAKIEGGEK